MRTNDEPKFVQSAYLARLLGLTTETVSGWCKSGKLPARNVQFGPRTDQLSMALQSVKDAEASQLGQGMGSGMGNPQTREYRRKTQRGRWLIAIADVEALLASMYRGEAVPRGLVRALRRGALTVPRRDGGE